MKHILTAVCLVISLTAGGLSSNPGHTETTTKAGKYVVVLTPSSDTTDISDKDMEAAAEAMRTRLDSAGYTESEVAVAHNKIEVTLPVEVSEYIQTLLTSASTITFTDYEDNIIIDASHISDVKFAEVNMGHGTEYGIDILFTTEGAAVLKEETTRISALPYGNNIIKIAIDDAFISAPYVSFPIENAECRIIGDFTREDAKKFVNQMRGGLLPYWFEIESIKSSEE